MSSYLYSLPATKDMTSPAKVITRYANVYLAVDEYSNTCHSTLVSAFITQPRMEAAFALAHLQAEQSESFYAAAFKNAPNHIIGTQLTDAFWRFSRINQAANFAPTD
ncbi:TPA: hypothetical protein I8V91_000821 [Corynebacterium striatum]|uniref:hypothetical protein n=2 Tax=Corynebacterium striatum TaxID=43770 RepID=UPI001A2F437E|nr:hypothetical protein [Corynebacterium striatum]HAT1252959.1 hypothetical protein [Corynebacterium striatum]HAT1267169.1 hypothetical protein [Corynebacterium striatum]HAT1294873.1 hypothetical protein [Corynebacterium striatum]HAT1304951.1 hypothetical protein [Corynebacterium striatum]